ncbi:hypothetical protein FB451DRAFT_1172665 [Mycena latifolia]|nr:hypothetical protein FB451DRAFT_1172665 [Mycena latifolia]
MQLSTSIFALALASIAAAVPFNNSTASSLVKRSVHCETSGGAPQPPTPLRPPDTSRASTRTTMTGAVRTTRAAPCARRCVGICSDSIFSFPGCDTCLDAGNGLLDIANSCSSGGLSGGWADAPFNLRLILFHS